MADDIGGLSFPDMPKLELDQLIDQLIANAQSVKRTQGRLRALLRAIETVTGDLALESVLRSIVSAAVELANARYGALGVIAHDRTLEQFIHVGIDDETAAKIGHLPRGEGLLGALITDPRPIRLRHRADDPRSTDFPPHHPPMDSFLGVPVTARGEVFGNLYLAESAHGEFSEEDEELVKALAAAAGTAITNARTYQEARLQQRWLEASIEIGTQMLSVEGEDPLRLIARRAIELAEADAVSISLVADHGKSLAVEVAVGDQSEALIGRRFPIGETIGGEVAQTGTPVLLADATTHDSRRTHHAAVLDAGPVMVLPMAGAGGVRGVISLLRARGRRPFTATDLAMAAGFAAHASVALELGDSRAAEQKLVLLEDRDRIARDLHDHVIQELFSVGLSLEGVAARQTEPKMADRVGRAIDRIDRTIRRIRTSVFELRGNFVDTEGGLRQSILQIASDCASALGFVPHVAFAGIVDVAIDDELADDVLAAVRESLSNVAKHARATDAFVDVVVSDNELTVTVSDNGIGPQGATRSSGTGNLRTRAERRGGSFELAAGPAGGTLVTWKVRLG